MKQGLVFLFLLCNATAFSQLGTRINSLAGNFVSINDTWNGLHNPAGIFNEPVTVAITHQSHANSIDVSRQAILLNLPFKKNMLSFIAHKHGYEHYKDQGINTAYARSFKNFSLGIALNYQTVIIPGHHKSNELDLQFGAQYKLHKYWRAGVSLNNITVYSRAANIKASGLYNVGITYQPNSQLLITTSAELRALDSYSTGLGIEYQLHPQISIRAGYHTHPFKRFIGLSFTRQRWTLSNALTENLHLGLLHQIELAYAF